MRINTHTFVMQKSIRYFLYGVLTGLIFCYLTVSFLIVSVKPWTPRDIVTPPLATKLSMLSENKAASPLNIERSVLSEDSTASSKRIVKPMMFKDKGFHHDDDTEAKNLKEKIRVLCWIMTSPNTLNERAIHVKNTWGKRCNTLLFMSSVANESFPVVGLNVSEGRKYLTVKTMLAFHYVYQHYFNEADWFLKADDDTYVILENLRYFLSGENKEMPVFFGQRFGWYLKQGFYSGGAGYVISKEALKRFGEKARSTCSMRGQAEDVDFARCMERLGVKTGNSTDILGRNRFHCSHPQRHLMGPYPEWYYLFDANGGKMGIKSMSDYTISFHHVKPDQMYEIEFFVYHLRPYGIRSHNQDLNRK